MSTLLDSYTNNTTTLNLANYVEKSGCDYFQFNLAIQQGRDYELTILHPGDVSTGIPTAEIRDDTIENSGAVLATFSFDPLVYDPGTDETTIILRLGFIDTEAIPTTPEIRGSQLQSPDKYNIWDAYLDISGRRDIIVQSGLVQVLGRSTA